MKKPIEIVIIGAGNIASHLAVFFSKHQDFKLVQIFNHRVSKEAKSLVKCANTALVSNYNKITSKADLYIIAVKDEAIGEVVYHLKNIQIKGLVVHTSGSTDLKILRGASSHIGVFYPLQTFYKGANIEWEKTPLLLEANSVKSMSLLKAIAKKISKTIKTSNSKNRLQIHLAAVFANNFTNALYTSAYQIIEKHLSKKDTKLLLPIIEQSVHKLQHKHPLQAQTGPAKRKDTITINKHLALLKNNSTLTNIYQLLSNLIIEQQSNS